MRNKVLPIAGSILLPLPSFRVESYGSGIVILVVILVERDYAFFSQNLQEYFQPIKICLAEVVPNCWCLPVDAYPINFELRPNFLSYYGL